MNSKIMKKTICLVLSLLISNGVVAQGVNADSTEVFEMPMGLETPKQEKTVEHAFFANYSLGWITSKVVTPYQERSNQGGHGFEIGYRCLFYTNWGLGICYEHNKTTYSGYPSDYELGLNSFTGSLIYGGHLGQKWIATVEFGVGYANYSDCGKKMKDGIVFKSALGAEYSPDGTFGIGLGISYNTSIFGDEKNKNYYKNENYINGFRRLAINAGIRLYL